MKKHEIITEQVQSGIIIGMELAKTAIRCLDLRDKIHSIIEHDSSFNLLSKEDKELLNRVKVLAHDNYIRLDSHDTVAGRVIELHTRDNKPNLIS